MKGVVFTGDRQVEIIDVPKPEPGPGDVVVRMGASGMCGSDMWYYRMPADKLGDQQKQQVRGHEPCGTVAELGPGARNVKVGDRVMLHHYIGCGYCKMCKGGWSQLCTVGKREGYASRAVPGHQEYVRVPDTCCVPLPDEMSFEEGASCACGTGTAYGALRRLQPSGMDTLAVYGQGPVGINAVMMAKAMGARVIAVDTLPARLALGKRFGADETVNAAEVDPVAAIKELTGGEGADCAVDCTGNGTAQVNMLRSTRLWGRSCFVGEHGVATIDVSRDIIHKHLTIYGSWTFSVSGLAEVADFIVKHKLPLRETITHSFPLSQADAAYKLFDTGTTGKIALVPDA